MNKKINQQLLKNQLYNASEILFNYRLKHQLKDAEMAKKLGISTYLYRKLEAIDGKINLSVYLQAIHLMNQEKLSLHDETLPYQVYAVVEHEKDDLKIFLNAYKTLEEAEQQEELEGCYNTIVLKENKEDIS